MDFKRNSTERANVYLNDLSSSSSIDVEIESIKSNFYEMFKDRLQTDVIDIVLSESDDDCEYVLHF